MKNLTDILTKLTPQLIDLQNQQIEAIEQNMKSLSDEKQGYVRNCIEKAKKGEHLDIKTIIDNLN